MSSGQLYRYFKYGLSNVKKRQLDLRRRRCNGLHDDTDQPGTAKVANDRTANRQSCSETLLSNLINNLMFCR